MWEIISVVIGRCCCDVESVEPPPGVLRPPFCVPSVSIIDAGLLFFYNRPRFCQNRNAAASLLTKLKGQKEEDESLCRWMWHMMSSLDTFRVATQMIARWLAFVCSMSRLSHLKASVCSRTGASHPQHLGRGGSGQGQSARRRRGRSLRFALRFFG